MKRLEYYKTALQIRTEWGMEDMQRDRDIPIPQNTETFYDIPYGTDPHWQILDIYRPKTNNGLLPVIVSIHGGGWIYSHKEYYRIYCASLTTFGYAVINFNYRLAPEHPYPAALEDINSLFGWVLEHAEEYQLDVNRICAVGDSAGAQMLSQYLTMLANPEYPAPFLLPQGFSIKATALNCGIYDLADPSVLEGEGSNRPYLSAYFCDEPEKYCKEIDIKPYVNEKFPPSYIMTSSYDFLKDKAKPFYDLLKERNVFCEYHLYGNENTPEMIHVFHCDMRLPQAWTCNQDECRFFDEVLSKEI